MLLSLASAAFMTQGSPAIADEPLFLSATQLSAKDAQWRNRIVILFAPSPKDPAFVEQMKILQDARNELIERDIVVLRDTDVSAPSNWRRQIKPTGFQAVLIGKDGGIKLRSDTPVTLSDLTGLIDAMPMRQQEMRDDS